MGGRRTIYRVHLCVRSLLSPVRDATKPQDHKRGSKKTARCTMIDRINYVYFTLFIVIIPLSLTSPKVASRGVSRVMLTMSAQYYCR